MAHLLALHVPERTDKLITQAMEVSERVGLSFETVMAQAIEDVARAFIAKFGGSLKVAAR